MIYSWLVVYDRFFPVATPTAAAATAAVAVTAIACVAPKTCMTTVIASTTSANWICAFTRPNSNVST